MPSGLGHRGHKEVGGMWHPRLEIRWDLACGKTLCTPMEESVFGTHYKKEPLSEGWGLGASYMVRTAEDDLGS